MNKNFDLVCYTDGASRMSKNLGSCSYAIFDRNNNHIYELSEVHKNTTNNRMEMTAMINLFNYLIKERVENKTISICSDSSYLLSGLVGNFIPMNSKCNTYSKRWIDGWIENDWISSSGKPVENKDLWIELDCLFQDLKRYNDIKFFHTRGHNKGTTIVEGNNYVDKLCNIALDEYLRKQV